MTKIDDTELKKIIIGRVVPHIYSFQTNTLPNYLKVGDTYRPVEERLSEWRQLYKDLTEVSRHKATINDEVFFRDHSVHKFLQQNGVRRVPLDQSSGVYSTEFFDGIGKSDVASAVDDIVDSYRKVNKYEYYNNLKEKYEYHFERNQDFQPRTNQQEVIDNFSRALSSGRSNLLMYAVMRFGKSITSMWCAKSIDSKLTVIVSAKADVKSEWKQTVESHKDFSGYRFMDSDDLKMGMDLADAYGNTFTTGSGEQEICTNVVLFLTLQDLAGSSEKIKEHHRILEHAKPDLLVIDETHFGARAQVLGKILAGVELAKEDESALKEVDDSDSLGEIDKLESIDANIKLHLSGTPYRILMGSEFDDDDIIAFIQFSDIYEAKINWNIENLDKDEWDNPYYGFPQMIRFAFNPNESSRKKLAEIPGSKPSELFTPTSTSRTGSYDEFVYEKEVTELLEVLDGSEDDKELLGLLDHDRIKEGKLARHIVFVLPFKASCDALEKLISDSASKFKNISDYKIFNISGHNKKIDKPEEVKAAIAKAESEGSKTITLTVNKMLTGSTVPQWDTMVYLKGTASPQEYDQAIFRLQSPWVQYYVDEEGGLIKYDMKPQTLLIDLDPTRLFYLQEVKAFTYGANVHAFGNENIEKYIQRELKVSPIIALNASKDKLVEINATKIMDEVRKYSNGRSISEDVNEIAIDLALRANEDIYKVISNLSGLVGRDGINIKPTEDEGDDLEGVENEPSSGAGSESEGASETKDDDDKNDSAFEKQFRTYYVMLLLFAFLSTTREKSLTDIIDHIDSSADNQRIAKSLGLKKQDLLLIRENINWTVLSSLDYKIQNSDFRALDESLTPLEHIDIAVHKFGKLSESEVFTPKTIVDRMYACLDDTFWRTVTSEKTIDIASKSGVFAQKFVEKALMNGSSIEEISSNFYSVPTSRVAYEFTRKMYEALGLNVENIAQHINTYDLIDHTLDVAALLSQGKKMSEITRDDIAAHAKITDTESEIETMKFAAVVGNPPYQENIPGRGDQPPIYHKFLESAYSLSDHVVMIHPARFLYNAGLTPKKWNEKMLNDEHLRVEYFEQNSAKVFPNTDIKGGVVITQRNAHKDFGAIGVYTSHLELGTILKKVAEKTQDTLDTIISGRGIYRLTEAAHASHPEVEGIQSKGHKNDVGTTAFINLKDILLHADKPSNDKEYAQVLGIPKGKRAYYWIERDFINNPPNFSKYKVILPKANGSGALGEPLSTPLVAGPNIGFTETFISIGAFESLYEAEAALKYIKTKFARTMLGVLKVTQDNPRDKWRKVPLQNFTSGSDIDWSQGESAIDKQLYAKYGLSEEEIAFIESHVKPME